MAIGFLAISRLCEGQEAVVATGGDAGSGGLQEIIVTAERRSERLQETPISVTAFSSDDIARQSMHNMSDLANAAPNLDIVSGSIAGGVSAQVYIRGIGQYDFASTADPGVGIYVDGVYLGRSVGSMLDLADVASVEVLRGPQGTLYGKNTIGGAINVTSVSPEGKPGAEIAATTGSYDRGDVKATIRGSLGDDVAGRITVLSRNQNGYGSRPLVDQSMGNVSLDAADAALSWTPASSLSIRVDLDGTHSRDHGPVRSLLATAQTPLMQLYNSVFGATLGPYNNRFVPTNPYVSFGTQPNYDHLDEFGGSLHVDWRIMDEIKLKSITSFRQLRAAWAADADNSPQDIVYEADTLRQHQFTQELQLSGDNIGDKLNWMAGIYYFKERPIFNTDVSIMPGLYQALGFNISEIVPDSLTTNSYAGYVHTNYAVTGALSLIAGLRYTYESKDYTVGAYAPYTGQVIIPTTPLSKDWSNTSWNLGLEYKFSADTMAYASVSTGFKSGGFNARPSLAGEVKPFNPETVITYELGMKSEWWDHRLRANASLFYNGYKDVQITVITATQAGALLTYIDNAANADGKGGELELTARPLQPLTVSASLGYIDARFTQTSPGSVITLSSHFVETPKESAHALATYSIPVWSAANLEATADYSYKSRIYNDPGNTPQLTQGGYGLANARLAYVAASGSWTVALFGTNLTDKRHLSAAGASILGSLGLVEGQWGPPREWGATISVSF